METLFNRILVFIFLILVTGACDHDENAIIENPPLSANEIEGVVTLPEGSTLDVNTLSISSPVGEVNIESGTYRMETLKDRFLTQLVGNANGDVYLMGYSYPGQTDFEINARSTALAMFMNLAPSLLMAPEGKQELIANILSNSNLSALAAKIDAVLVAGQSPLSLEETEIAQLVANTYVTIFEQSSKQNLKSDDESYPIEILQSGKELTFINPGKSYETVVGIYKDDQHIKAINVERVSFFPTSIIEIIGAIIDANLGQVPSGLQPIEKTFTMDGDGKYEIKVRNGFYSNGIDTENVQAYLTNLINWDSDIILEFLPVGDCVVPTIKALKSFISNTVTLSSTQNASSGEILSLLLDLLITAIDQSPIKSGCFADENVVFFEKLKKLFKFTDLAGKLGKVGNVAWGIVQWVYDDGAMDKCYQVEGGVVTECEDVNVYVAGYEYNGITNVAKVWKNGVAISLTDGSSNALANSVYVSDNDVYVAGYEYNESYGIAKFWKNGVPNSLKGGALGARANSVYVLDTDVYVAGHDFNNSGMNVATVWKNGVSTFLTDGSNHASARSVYVLDSDVYVAGYDRNGNENIAMIWKNGVPTSLTGGAHRANANSIYVSDNDVYVAGYESNGSKNVAKVWKNGEASSLTDGSNNALANSVYVLDNDVYVVGYEHNGNKSVAKVWKNGVATSLTDGSNNASANSIYVIGNDVYTVGDVSNVATLWKNGIAISLSDDLNSNALSVFIK